MKTEKINEDCTHMKEGKCRIYGGKPVEIQCTNCYAYTRKKA